MRPDHVAGTDSTDEAFEGNSTPVVDNGGPELVRTPGQTVEGQFLLNVRVAASVPGIKLGIEPSNNQQY